MLKVVSFSALATLKPQAGIAVAPVGVQQPVSVNNVIIMYYFVNCSLIPYNYLKFLNFPQQYGAEAAGVADQPMEEAGMTPEVIQKVMIFSYKHSLYLCIYISLIVMTYFNEPLMLGDNYFLNFRKIAYFAQNYFL